MTQTVLLGDICTKITDGAHWSPKSTDDGYPMASVKDMLDNRINIETCRKISEEDYRKLVNDGCRPEKNDVLIAKDGSYLKHMFVSDGVDDVVLLSSIAILRPDTTLVDPRFLAYYIRNQRDNYDLSQYVSGAAIPRIILKNFARMPISLPDLDTQKKIADVLGTIDEKIELNRQMNETLEQMGQALFRHYFIDNPEAEKWEDDYINTQVDIKYGKNLPTKNLKDEGYPVFGGNGQIGYYEKYIYEHPMVLVACRGAASGDINISKPKSFVTNNSLALEIRSDSNFTFEYLRFYSYCRKNGYHEFVSGSAQPQITVESLSKCRIPIPSRESIGSFTEQARHLVERMLANEEQTHALTTLRDTLLPRLINGKVRL